MKNLRIVIVVFFFAALAACEDKDINPSSNVTIQQHTIDNYTGIQITDAFEVDVTISDAEEKIEIETNENIHAYIDVIKSGNDLVIKIKDNTDIQGSTTLKAHITTSNPLEKLAIGDASSLVMKNSLEANHILLIANDASLMSVNVIATTTEVRVEDASEVNVTGTCGSMDLYAYDASDLDGLGMIVNNVVARMDGASGASLTVNETIDLVAKDACKFSYKGNPVITNIDLSGASQIIKLD